MLVLGSLGVGSIMPVWGHIGGFHSRVVLLFEYRTTVKPVYNGVFNVIDRFY